MLNLCQMFGGRLLLGNQNPEAECSSVSSNERQEQSCKKHTLKMEMDFGAHSQGQLRKNTSHFCCDYCKNVKLWSKCPLKGVVHAKNVNCHLFNFV